MNKSEIEKIFIRRVILSNSPLLDKILPGVFTEPAVQVLCWIAKTLKQSNIRVTYNNVTLFFIKEKYRIKRFMQKMKVAPSLEEIVNIINPDIIEPQYETSPEFLEEVFESIKEDTFRRFAEQRAEDIKRLSEIPGKSYEIIANAKAITKLHEIFSSIKIEEDWITKSAVALNSVRIIPTAFKDINHYIFGWSRGYPNAILARSSHGKSTFITNEIKYQLSKGLKVALISVEENPETVWQRFFCNEFHISITDLKLGTIKITPEQIQTIKEKYGNLALYHANMVYYNQVLTTLNRIVKDMDIIFIDHINAIKYPGGSNDIANMPGGIVSLINAQKMILTEHKQCTIINVNQVSEKQIANIPSYWKMPDYTMAYGNTVSYFASREWITLYYPYRDLINRPSEWVGVIDLPSPNELYFAVEKSSTGTIGGGILEFIPEYAKILDRKKKFPQVQIQQEELFNEITNKKRQN